MPFKSEAQNRWAHTAEGTKALGGPAKVKEWEGATDYSHLPQKLAKGGTVKHEAPNESPEHEARETPAEEAWEQRTGQEIQKGKRGGHGLFAEGGPVRNHANDRFFKTDTRDEFGRFLGTPDEFTGGRKPAGYPEEAKTDENWTKPKGVGLTDADDYGDCKSLKPVLPHTKAGERSYAKE